MLFPIAGLRAFGGRQEQKEWPRSRLALSGMHFAMTCLYRPHRTYKRAQSHCKTGSRGLEFAKEKSENDKRRKSEGKTER